MQSAAVGAAVSVHTLATKVVSSAPCSGGGACEGLACYGSRPESPYNLNVNAPEHEASRTSTTLNNCNASVGSTTELSFTVFHSAEGLKIPWRGQGALELLSSSILIQR